MGVYSKIIIIIWYRYSVLITYKDCFAWDYDEIFGLDISLIKKSIINQA